jgi:hypothetical protein
MTDLNGKTLEAGQTVIVYLKGRIGQGTISSVESGSVLVKVEKDNFKAKSWAKSHYGESKTVKVLARTTSTRLAIIGN